MNTLSNPSAQPSAPSSGGPNMSSLGLGMSVFSAITGAIGSFYSAQSQRSALKHQQNIANINARISEMGAQSALLAGQREIGRLTMRAGHVKGAQRAAMAANGIDLGVGNAAEIQASTDLIKEIDANTLQANAVHSAWGYRTQSMNYRNDATMRGATASSISPASAGFSSLLGGAGDVAKAWYAYKKEA